MKHIANARSADPLSSVLAGETIESSGKASMQRLKALAAVRSNPGLTSKELSAKTGLDRYMLARRLPELLVEVEKGAMRICSVSKRICVTWVLRQHEAA